MKIPADGGRVRIGSLLSKKIEDAVLSDAYCRYCKMVQKDIIFKVWWKLLHVPKHHALQYSVLYDGLSAALLLLPTVEAVVGGVGYAKWGCIE